jgi:hypothetical protein
MNPGRFGTHLGNCEVWKSEWQGGAPVKPTESYEVLMRLMGERQRKVPKSTQIHAGAKDRWEAAMPKKYRPDNLKKFVKDHGWPNLWKD